MSCNNNRRIVVKKFFILQILLTIYRRRICVYVRKGKNLLLFKYNIVQTISHVKCMWRNHNDSSIFTVHKEPVKNPFLLLLQVLVFHPPS